MMNECLLLSLHVLYTDYAVAKSFFHPLNHSTPSQSAQPVAPHPFNQPRRLVERSLDDLISVIFCFFLKIVLKLESTLSVCMYFRLEIKKINPST